MKSPILVAFVVDASEQITTNLAMRRSAQTDTREQSFSQQPPTVPVLYPVWSTDNGQLVNWSTGQLVNWSTGQPPNLTTAANTDRHEDSNLISHPWFLEQMPIKTFTN